jgi:DNA invertase Pin-like site-specific DNA recombinase
LHSRNAQLPLLYMRAIGYVRVSKGTGYSLDAQRERIDREAERRDWRMRYFTDDNLSGGSLKRPGLQTALSILGEGRAKILCVAKLDRLSRSVGDFVSLADRATREGWSIVALDIALDMTTPQGSLVAQMMATFAEFERRVTAERTREGLAEARARGVKLGRPQAIPSQLLGRMRVLRAEGWTLQRIADQLTAEGVTTAQGGRRWWSSTISAALARADRDNSDAPSDPATAGSDRGVT